MFYSKSWNDFYSKYTQKPTQSRLCGCVWIGNPNTYNPTLNKLAEILFGRNLDLRTKNYLDLIDPYEPPKIDESAQDKINNFELQWNVKVPSDLKTITCWKDIDKKIMKCEPHNNTFVTDWVPLAHNENYPKKNMILIMIENQGCCFWYAGWNDGEDSCCVFVSEEEYLDINYYNKLKKKNQIHQLSSGEYKNVLRGIRYNYDIIPLEIDHTYDFDELQLCSLSLTKFFIDYAESGIAMLMAWEEKRKLGVSHHRNPNFLFKEMVNDERTKSDDGLYTIYWNFNDMYSENPSYIFNERILDYNYYFDEYEQEFYDCIYNGMGREKFISAFHKFFPFFQTYRCTLSDDVLLIIGKMYIEK